MRQVALMLAVDELRTLRAAAGQLGMTQPAATKMLHELESALGQPLFERAGRGLQLNAAGERVTGYFRSIRGSMEALNRELGELKLGSAGKLAVGSIMAASPGRLTDAMLGLKREIPQLWRSRSPWTPATGCSRSCAKVCSKSSSAASRRSPTSSARSPPSTTRRWR